MDLPKYPRTFHLEGSKGVRNSDSVGFTRLQNKHLVIEEKMDGSCVAVGFDNAMLSICHRNNEVKSSEFDLLKSFCAERLDALYYCLEDRFILYGEWMLAKHSIYYDSLPSYLIEYDVYDRQNQIYLSTPARQDLLRPLQLNSAFVLNEGKFSTLRELEKLIGPSRFVSDDQSSNFLKNNDIELTMSTDLTGLMEGLYIKLEENDRVVGRFKYIRKEFVDLILRSGHWNARSVISNQLR